MDMEMKSEPCEIGGDVEMGLAGVADEDFSEAEETEVKPEKCAVAIVKVKAKSRRGKTNWSKASKYAKTKTSPQRIPKPTPKDDEWLPESESGELIPTLKESQSPPPKIKIQAIKKTKGVPFKTSVIARIISTKGVTIHRYTIRRKDPSLFKPFQQTPMKYDSSTDTISVGDIPVIIDENKKSLKCSSCALEFQGNSKLPAEFQIHEHILGQHLEAMKCPVCDKVMRKINSFINHLLCHQGHNPCDICGRPFYEKNKMIRHKVIHMNASERAEAEGKGNTKTLLSLAFDAYLSKNEKKISKEVISTLKKIIGNEETSVWKRKMLCRVVKEGAKQTDKDKDSPTTKFPICYDEATDKLSVSGIEIIMNETELCLKCSSCSVIFHGKSVVQRVELSMHNHILSKHLDALRCPFPAEQCTSSTRSFETPLKYHQHLKYHHPKEAQEHAVCEICGTILKSCSSLSSHRARHYKAKVRIRKPKSTMKLNLPLKHKCSTCGKGFWDRERLKRHAVSHLPPEQRKSFICNRCGKKFPSGFRLNRHQKVTCFEKGQEPPRLPCQFCSSTLKNKDQLRKHIATIHPEQNLGDERPFQCSMCPQRFKTEWSVEGHERMKHAVTEGGGIENGNGNPEKSGYRCRKGCGKLIATEHGRNVHESYCDGEGCKTERERSKSKKKDL